MSSNVRRGFPWRWVGWGGAVALLLVPLIAMQLTSEVNWTGFDFAFAAILVGSIGLGLELAFRASASRPYRAAVGLALGAPFLLIWINGAVGIIGEEGEVANLLYLVASLVGLAGASIARFRPAGMARAMTAAAVVTLATPAVGHAALGASDAVFAREVAILTVLFAAMWLASAHLFRKAR